jgi:hypothetical protein
MAAFLSAGAAAVRFVRLGVHSVGPFVVKNVVEN